MRPLKQLLLQLAYPLLSRLPRRRRRQGVAVALWRGEEMLFVRCSYRPGWSLPGGTPHRGEPAREAAARELREETGIAIPAESLRSAFVTAWVHLFEVEPGGSIDPRPDGVEVVEASFLRPGDVPDLPEFVSD